MLGNFLVFSACSSSAIKVFNRLGVYNGSAAELSCIKLNLSSEILCSAVHLVVADALKKSLSDDDSSDGSNDSSSDSSDSGSG